MRAQMVGKLWDTDLWMDEGDPISGPLLRWSHEQGGDPAARGLLVRIADVMADVEFHDLRVDRLFVLRRNMGHVVVAKVAPGEFFHENGKRTNFSLATPCPECGGHTRIANPVEGHLEGCPMRTVLEVMGS